MGIKTSEISNFICSTIRESSFILLHIFIKKTLKTPKADINRANAYLKDFYTREISDE